MQAKIRVAALPGVPRYGQHLNTSSMPVVPIAETSRLLTELLGPLSDGENAPEESAFGFPLEEEAPAAAPVRPVVPVSETDLLLNKLLGTLSEAEEAPRKKAFSFPIEEEAPASVPVRPAVPERRAAAVRTPIIAEEEEQALMQRLLMDLPQVSEDVCDAPVENPAAKASPADREETSGGAPAAREARKPQISISRNVVAGRHPKKVKIHIVKAPSDPERPARAENERPVPAKEEPVREEVRSVPPVMPAEPEVPVRPDPMPRAVSEPEKAVKPAEPAPAAAPAAAAEPAPAAEPVPAPAPKAEVRPAPVLRERKVQAAEAPAREQAPAKAVSKDPEREELQAKIHAMDGRLQEIEQVLAFVKREYDEISAERARLAALLGK